ncbi:HNH endonuclease [Cellulomonas wangsupingiae]|uniref:HNH endonuclease n=1 Tax=Cellulomonas wangsupingiae TaxID=2968085 RepID=A0ABY5K824_9CELL|nr:HNH endonuclease [Cellulomonas wangsupingiae]MCC2334236.1 HNH endonuclease [Cellulomonas wangsupingiae]MCM0641528.1 HNH endonuclease [Cellulomonas wangsupingiae]UUI65913.1 HNH endonuclease [Cellulomonas wangsupingiae]
MLTTAASQGSHQDVDRAPMPTRALLLNASGDPLCIVTLHRAVMLVMSGKATVLESDGRMLHSPHVQMPLPVVLVLTRYVHVPHRRPVPPTRRTVLQRDDHRCAYCGGGADTVDHVQPRSRGGRHEWTNVVAACVRCNHRKADRTLHELGWELPFRPRAPRWSVTVGGAAGRAEPAWSPYLVA